MSKRPSGTEDWLKVFLGEICELAYGKSLPKAKRSGCGFPVYGSNGPVGHHKDALTDGPAIIVGRKGSFGEIHFSTSRCSPIDTTYYITEKQTKCYLPWLARRLRGLGLKSLNKAATIPGLNREDAYRLPLLLPPLPEQKRIAAILDAVDALRAKRRESIEQLDSLTQSTFLEMFGDPVMNPKGWEVKAFENVCNKITDGEHGTVERVDQGVLYLMARNIAVSGDIDLTNVSFIKDVDHQRIVSRCNPEVDDILLVCVGATIGKTALVPAGLDFSLARSVALIKPDRALLAPSFLNQYLRSEPGQSQLFRSRNTAAQSGLYLGKIKKLELIVPPLDLQNRFASIVESIEQQKVRLKTHLAELDTLFASLQSRAFNGEL